MAAQRAAAEPEVREFDAEVRAVDGTDVVLDRTYFYAESGGQPADRGTIAGVPVVGVRFDDAGTIVHALSEPPALDEGDEVVGVVDESFRTYCARAHTASHALYGAARRLLDDLGYGGFDIGREKVRVDFETTTDVTDDALVELERLANRSVWESHPVSWEEIPADEARERGEVAFNAKTEEGVLADSDLVRVVTIGDGADPWDVAACGGTHVSNTGEIGPIEALDRSNPGEGLTRIEFAVGPVAIDRRAEVRRATFETARTLGTAVDDAPDSVARLLDEKAELESELRSLKSEVLDTRLADLGAVKKGGAIWRVGSVDGFGPNDVGERLKERAGESGDVLVVAGEGGSTFVVAASTGDVEAGEIVADVTDEFGGGGGGGPTFAQGGGLSATPAEVVDFLRG
ncbi:alanyl-tRNA editing protein [Halegenticoccus tardaugens]|uniref:alanyl-tRNA editing protein n=1 Tax=Halegenticoccus tardaugens TaxID=2071624 RepID=UPI00100A6D59|nr:DHHA1 domain-containing protein [Halegenticoccus tardaugens]